MSDAVAEARGFSPEIVICEYEFLTATSINRWEADEVLSLLPLIAVSLTRRPSESPVTSGHGIGGFFYLPLLDPEAAMRIIRGAALASRNRYVPASPTTSAAVSANV